MSLEPCPDNKKLTDFSLGELSWNELNEIEKHLDHCSKCSDAICSLEDQHDELLEDLQKFTDQKNFDNEMELNIAIQGVKAIGSGVSSDSHVLNKIHSTKMLIHIDDYKIVREIGRGGMGVVYEARQLSLRRRVAIKFLPFSFLSGNRKKRFEIESQAVAMLQHENIISVYSSGETNGNPYYVMPFIEGINLQLFMDSIHSGSGVLVNDIGNSLVGTPKLVDGGTETISFDNVKSSNSHEDFQLEKDSEIKLEQDSFPLPTYESSEYLKTIVGFGIQTAYALQHAHEMGIIHRDIKPSNLLINHEGHLWVTDFGLARIESDDAATQTGDVIGTIRYMSPEQAVGKKDLISNRTDVYSLGVTLYELATLSPFFVGESKQLVLQKVINEEPVLPRKMNPKIPKDLETIILKATDKKIENRFSSAKEMADDLSRFLENRPILAKRPTQFDKFIKLCGRYKVATVSILSGLAILAIVSFAFMLVFSAQNRELEKAKDETENSRNETLNALMQANEQNYAMSMRLASEAIKEDDTIRAKELISSFEPKGNQTDLRGMEWFVLKNETDKFQEVHQLSSKPLYTICRNETKGIIAVAGAESLIRIMDINSLSTINEIQTDQGEVNGLDFTSNGETIASAGDDGTVKLWVTNTGKLLQEIPVFKGADEKTRVHAVIFSPDEKRIVCSGNTDFARILSLENPTQIRDFAGHTRDVTAIDISQDGQYLVTGSQDKTVRLWDISKREEIKKLNVPRRRTNWSHVTGLDISKDQKTVVIGAKNHSVYIWNIETDELRTIGSHKDPVQSVSFSPDETMVVASDRSGSIKVWPADNEVDLSDSSSLNPAFSQLLHPGKIYSVTTGGEDNILYSVGEDGGLRKSFLNSNKKNSIFNEYKDIVAYRYSEDSGFLSFLNPEGIHVFKENEDDFEHYWDIPIPTIKNLNLLQGGKLLVSCSNNGQVQLWDISRKKLQNTWNPNGFPIPGDVLISRDFKTLVVCMDMNIGLFKIDDKSPEKLSKIMDLKGKAAIHIPGQNRFAFTFEDSVSVWDFDKQDLLNKYVDLSGGVDGYCVSPEENVIYISDKNRTIHFWNYETGKAMRETWKHNFTVTGIALSPDQKTLITTDRNNQLTFWNIKTGQPVHSFKYRFCEPISFLNSGKLISQGKNTRGSLDILNFGRFWNEHYKANYLNGGKL